jgi:hypothetical protein
MLTLNDVSGDLGGAKFPMRCRMETAADGFRLQATEGSCQELAGLSFKR